MTSNWETPQAERLYSEHFQQQYRSGILGCYSNFIKYVVERTQDTATKEAWSEMLQAETPLVPYKSPQTNVIGLCRVNTANGHALSYGRVPIGSVDEDGAWSGYRPYFSDEHARILLDQLVDYQDNDLFIVT